MKHKTLLVFLIATGLAIFAACGDNDESPNGPINHSLGTASTDLGYFTITAEHQPTTPTAGVGELLLVVESDDQNVEGLIITVEPWMPGHGHGSNTVPDITEEGDGTYRITNVVYTMPGLWEARIALEAGDVEDTITFEYDVE